MFTARYGIWELWTKFETIKSSSLCRRSDCTFVTGKKLREQTMNTIREDFGFWGDADQDHRVLCAVPKKDIRRMYTQPTANQSERCNPQQEVVSILHQPAPKRAQHSGEYTPTHKRVVPHKRTHHRHRPLVVSLIFLRTETRANLRRFLYVHVSCPCVYCSLFLQVHSQSTTLSK